MAEDRQQEETNRLLQQLLEEQKKANRETPAPPPPAPEPPPEDPKFNGVFNTMIGLFQDNLDFVMAADARELAERRADRAERRREQASREDSDRPGLRERLSESVKGINERRKDSLDNLKGIGKFITKGLGVALIAPVIVKFISGLVDGVIEEAFGEEAAKKFGSEIKVGGIMAVIGGLLFGPMAILPLFFAGVIGTLGKKLVDGISEETLDKFGIDKKSLGGVVAAVGAALGLFVPTLLKKAIMGTGSLALAAVRGSATLAATAVSTASTAAAGAAGAPRPAPAPGAPPRPAGVPSGMRVNSAGRVINANTGRFASADDIAKAMKAEGRMAKVAKYMKFFKFAGPALAVVPALIDPLMAIYNEESEQEIKKQLVGALGTVGGVALGGLAGTALGTGIFPGVGSLIGGLVGAGAGAFLGEDLAEMIAEAVLSGKDLDPKRVNSGQARRLRRQNNRSNVTPSATTVSGTDTNISPEDVSIVPTGGDTAQARIGVMEAGTQANVFAGGASSQFNVAKGGDTNNQTNVGGSSTTFNIINNGSNSLQNSPHLPVSQSV